MIRGVLLSLLCLAGCTLAAEITDCSKPDAAGKLKKVIVSNCTEEDASCVLKRGTKSTISIDFETTEEILKLKHSVHGIIRSVPIPFKLPNEDACIGTGLKCPLAAGDHTYGYELPIKAVYPTVAHLIVKWEITDVESGKNVVCLEIPAQVK